MKDLASIRQANNPNNPECWHDKEIDVGDPGGALYNDSKEIDEKRNLRQRQQQHNIS